MTPMQTLAYSLYCKEYEGSVEGEWHDLPPHRQLFFLEVAERKMLNVLGDSPDMIISRELVRHHMNDRAKDKSHSSQPKLSSYAETVVKHQGVRSMHFAYNNIKISLPDKTGHTRIALCHDSREIVWWDVSTGKGSADIQLHGLQGQFEVTVS